MIMIGMRTSYRSYGPPPQNHILAYNFKIMDKFTPNFQQYIIFQLRRQHDISRWGFFLDPVITLRFHDQLIAIKRGYNGILNFRQSKKGRYILPINLKLQ